MGKCLMQYDRFLVDYIAMYIRIGLLYWNILILNVYKTHLNEACYPKISAFLSTQSGP